MSSRLAIGFGASGERGAGSDGETPFTGVVRRYEVVDGIWVAFALSQNEGAHPLSQEITSVVFGSIPPERFAPPSN
ncbi:MAG: hypothetical protein ABI592_06420 [Acidobacteriota bacterium]